MSGQNILIATGGAAVSLIAVSRYDFDLQALQYYDPLGFLVFFIGWISGVVFLIAHWCESNTTQDSNSSCDSQDVAEREEDIAKREASLMREIARHQDAHTALMRSEIDYTRTYGEYRERPEIAEHEQRLRELRSRLR